MSGLMPAASAAAVVVIAAALPDPREPTFIVFAGAVGALIGATIGRLRRSDRERTREIAENWAYAATLVAVGAYLVLLAGVP